MSTNILCSGLGGGLDVINASLLYYAARQEGVPAILGSTRTADVSMYANHAPFADSGTIINSRTTSTYVGPFGKERYPESKIATHLGEEVVYFARKYEQQQDVPRLREAVLQAQGHFGVNHLFFVDAGGDCLTLRAEDASIDSEGSDPFAGGDAAMLMALRGIPNTYLATVAIGLDIREEAFFRNLELLQGRGGYFGRVNLATGEKEHYALDHILALSSLDLEAYFALTEQIVFLHGDDEGKAQSHTAVVTYHALKGNFGLQRTYVPWEPKVEGAPGVIVTPEHQWMYFFDPTKVEELKRELNRR